MKKILYTILLPALLLSACSGPGSIDIRIPDELPGKDRLCAKFLEELGALGIGFESENPTHTLSYQWNASVGKEAYRLAVDGGTITLEASDINGFTYGSQEIREQIRMKGSLFKLESKTEAPALPFRAIKFNLPFMAYRSDKSLAQHDLVCRDLDFWEKFLDMMEENRFNVLSLWSLHPYHYMVIPENFPEATHFSEWEMAEWKKFWTSLFHMAKDRGIDTYIINWNTFVSPSFARAHDVARYSGKPWHFGPGDTSPVIDQYTREVIRQVIDEYPDLTGLGITLGERMGGQGPDERRAWLERTIFAGMRDAGRKIKFVYRAPLSANRGSGGSTSEENDLKTRQQIESLDTEGPVWLEFKYNWSHGHSSPDLFIVHGGKLTDKYRNPVPDKYKYVWTMRNEDFFIHRWGQPDFIREFIQNNGHEYVGGCFIGSEVFIPALDYTSKDGFHKTWEYSFERHWLWYGLWGRLLYNPGTDDELFETWLEDRYGKGMGGTALEAWKTATRIPLHFASFHQGRNDLSMYLEGFTGWGENTDLRFYDIEKFPHYRVLDTIRYVNIADYVLAGKENLPSTVIPPPALADSLDALSGKTLDLAARLRSRNPAPAVACELADLEAWAWFGKYFADKIRASIALADYRMNNNDRRQEAVEYLEKCVSHWENYAEATTRYNREEFLFHTRDPFSWYGMLTHVKKDIELARRSNEEAEKEE